MVFSDLFFLFVFLPLFVICYLAAYYIDKKKSLDGAGSMAFKNAVLVAFSLIFYAWGEPIYVFLMLICVIINYFAELKIGVCLFFFIVGEYFGGVGRLLSK